MSKQEKKSNFTYNHARRLYRAAQKKPDELFQTFKSSYKGLTKNEVEERLKLFGENLSEDHKDAFSFFLLLKAIRNPVNYLIFGVAIVSFFTGNERASILMFCVTLFSIIITFIQELRFKKVVNKLLTMSLPNVTVIRNYLISNQKTTQPPSPNHEIPITELVPGDIVRIAAGDIIPADIRLLSSKNLLVNQSVLTGETIPVDKDSEFDDALLKNLPDLKNICFLGSSVVNGTGIGIVIHTGFESYVNSIAKQQKIKKETSFDNGAHTFVVRTIKFMLIMIPLTFIFHLIAKGSWIDGILFALTITVSLTPKSLPLTITGNLSRAALNMLKKRMVVKHLTAIENLGGMDILCTDKTGTLTEDLSVCGGAFNLEHKSNDTVMLYAYLNSYFQTSLKNHLDFALINHANKYRFDLHLPKYEYIDELPYDEKRKRISILVKYKDESTLLICKGALEDILPVCISNDSSSHLSMVQKINELGCHSVAIAYKKFSDSKINCQIEDEIDFQLIGYVTFLDPPVKKGIPELLKSLEENGVSIKIMTGDNHWDAAKVAKEVGLKTGKIILGSHIDSLTDDELKNAITKSNLFAKLSPDHKQRLVTCFQDLGHTVGYMGDGINDVPALFSSDVGISVNNAVSTAKESSDIVLLEKDLFVILEGIIEGRKAFLNIDKYIKITAITKFSSLISILGSSFLLPFLPLKPIQMLIQNILYDFSQAGIPFDKVEKKLIEKPSKWEFTEIQKLRFTFGPVLAVFDFATFILMWHYFKTNVPKTQGIFQSAWLIESLISQSLVIHLFHTNLNNLSNLFKKPSFLTTLAALMIGIYFPYSPAANLFGFSQLPYMFFVFLLLIIFIYCITIILLKLWLNKNHGFQF
jgi:Mg2+-importing ATPase